MKQKPHSAIKRLLLAFIMLAAISILGRADGAAQEAAVDAENAVSGGVTVEVVSQTEWRIINPEGAFVGTLKSVEQKGFTFFDTDGTFIGTITESGAWFHRLYRKRDTRITPDEAKLYTDALKAIEAVKK